MAKAYLKEGRGRGSKSSTDNLCWRKEGKLKQKKKKGDKCNHRQWYAVSGYKWGLCERTSCVEVLDYGGWPHIIGR